MIKSADKKPEKYVGPDGKPKIRMVPVDKEVVKSEGGMKRIATTQSNKADRMAAGDKKGLETFKKKTDEACWDSHKQVGMKKKGNKMVPNCVPKNEAYSMKEMVCKSCGDAYGKPTNEACMYDAYDMAGENWCSRKEYMTAQKKNEANTYVGQRDKMKIIGRKPHPDGGHIVTLQTQAGKTIKRHLKNGKVKDMNEEVKSVDEVLDTPGAMDRYHNKAKAQSDRARNSATAKIVRGNKDISKEKDVIRRREKGMDMATNVRAKQFRKAVTKKPYGEATTKVAKVSDSDREKLLKLRKMLDKEKNK